MLVSKTILSLVAVIVLAWPMGGLAQNSPSPREVVGNYPPCVPDLGVSFHRIREWSLSDPYHLHIPGSDKNFFYDPETKCWKDAKTGGVVPTIPTGAERDRLDRNHATNPYTGDTYFFDAEKQCWINSKTGKAVCCQCPPEKPVAPGGFQDQTHQNQPVTPQPATPKTEEPKQETSGFGFGIGIGGGYQRGGHRDPAPQRRDTLP